MCAEIDMTFAHEADMMETVLLGSSSSGHKRKANEGDEEAVLKVHGNAHVLCAMQPGECVSCTSGLAMSFLSKSPV